MTEPVSQALDILSDIRRLASLIATGLDNQSDSTFDLYAKMITNHIDAPVGLVSLVDDHRQFFPGASGLVAKSETRQTGLETSVCQNVVTSGEPLISNDLRELTDLPGVAAAVEQNDVLAYAGFPLIGIDGQVVGSLCAIDTTPHEWSEYEVDTLRDLATVCSSELQARGSLHNSEEKYDDLRIKYDTLKGDR